MDAGGQSAAIACAQGSISFRCHLQVLFRYLYVAMIIERLMSRDTDAAPVSAVIRTAAVTAAVFIICFATLWFGVALSPLLFNRNHSCPPSSRATGWTNRPGELLSAGKTLVYAFHYVVQPDPVEKPARGERNTIHFFVTCRSFSGTNTVL